MGDWSNGYDGGLQNRRLGFDSLVPRLIDAVIFDLDGVLLDSEAAWRDAKRDVVEEWGGTWKEEASRAMLGMSAPEWSVYMRDDLAVERAAEEIDAEVVDLRTIRPLDTEAVLSSVTRTHRCVVAEEGWPFAGVGAQVVDSIQREAFDELDAPILRVTGADVPMPYNKHLEKAAKVDPARVVAAVHSVVYRD